MSITVEEPRVDVQPLKKPVAGTQLFGTLLASKPVRSRSPLALAVSVTIHVVLLGLLVLASRHFIPRIFDADFEVGLAIPEEEPHVVIVGGGAGEEVAATPGPQGPVKPDEPLRYVPGPISPIPEITPGPETAEPSDAGGGGGRAPSSLADRLRPSTIDPRLRAGTRYAPSDASPVEGVRSRVALSLRAYNDSVAAETDARRRALDWTIKTKDGKQWGIGPDGKIHLGDITLPAVALSPPPGRREEIASRNRDFAEIERQAAQEIGRQSFKERVKAIRARKDKERAEEKKKEGENAPITN
jgi:hypothetical protein